MPYGTHYSMMKMNNTMSKLFAPSLVSGALSSALLLSSCQMAEVREEVATPNSQTNTEATSTTVAGACDNSAIHINNPEFTFDYQRGRPSGWLINQHGGDKTYEVMSREGTIRINNFGMQYWMRLSQRYPAHELVGKTFRFSADIKMDLNPEGWIQTLTPGGGLTVVVKGLKPGHHNPKSVLLSVSMPNEPRHGKIDWRRLNYEFTVPEGARTLELGFLHQAHGEMWIKNPELVEVGC